MLSLKGGVQYSVLEASLDFCMLPLDFYIEGNIYKRREYGANLFSSEEIPT